MPRESLTIKSLFSLAMLARIALLSLILFAIALLAIRFFAPTIWEGIGRVVERNYLAASDWYYDLRVTSDDFAIEDPAARAALPQIKTIQAIEAADRTLQIVPPSLLSGDWPRSTGDAAATRFSLANQIAPDNVSQLEIAWTYEGEDAANVQATPVFDGTRLYAVSPSNTIIAMSPADGALLWEFDPGSAPAKRGLVLSSAADGNATTVLFAAGTQLHALDGATGNPLASFSGGSVTLAGESKVAPAICGQQIISANTRSDPTVQAFDLQTGAENWTVELRPNDLPRGTGGRPSRQTGGNPWGGFTVDSNRCIAYVSTGNPAPVLVGVERRGDNPGSSSVIAIDLETGKIIWRFQEVRHDLWDLDIPAPPLLTSITLDGAKIDVVATPTKTGNTLLLDRLTGKPIFDWRLQRAPTSGVPGERTAPYQPAPVLPESFSRQVFSAEEVTNIGERNTQSVLAKLSNALFGFYQPPSPSRQLVFYGLHGGAEWPGAAGDPRDGSFFVAANNVPSILGLVAEKKVTLDKDHLGRQVYLSNCAACHGQDLEGAIGPQISDSGHAMSKPAIRSIITNGQQAMPAIELGESELEQVVGYLSSGSAKTGGPPRFRRDEYRRLYDFEGYPGSKPPWGTLTRLDLNTGKIVWQVPLGIDRELEARGITGTGTENFGGLLSTASGLIFASGTKDSMIHAFSSENGELLWSHKLPFIGSAPPMTYVFEGEQYVLVPATGGGTLRTYDNRVQVGNAFVAFKLPSGR